jgi:adenine-specific DNA-methyltransferase
MSQKSKKLELTWYNKDKSLYYDPEKKKYQWVDKKDPRVSEPRILLEKAVYGDKNTENILIKGDNLLALKALLPDYEGKIKLIYIDPPFNTGAAFEFYDDGLEHSIWLTMMRDRIDLLHKLLNKRGLIFVHIDSREFARLKMIMDEKFGDDNFVSFITVQVKDVAGVGQQSLIFDVSEYILVYAKDYKLLREEGTLQTMTEVEIEGFVKGYNKALLNPGKSKLIKTIQRLNIGEIKIYKCENYEIKKFRTSDSIDDYYKHFNNVFADYNPSGGTILQIRPEIPQKGLSYIEYIPTKGKYAGQLIKTYFLNGRIVAWLKEVVEKKKDGTLIKKQRLSNIWKFPNAALHLEGGVEFKQSKKPEALIKLIIELATKPGDIVLDSFAGSGTTGAVAHKMGRKWIMVELGEHAKTHIIPRLKRVISGEDQSGISKEVGWKGGGGFKYFELGDSLFVADDDLRLTVLNPKVYNGDLIRAVLKVEGFKLLNPDNALHGISGRTIAHVTEQYLSQDYVNAIVREVGDKADYLIIYAKTISSKIKLPENVEVRKIPDVLLKKFKV